jgi:riboflavin biosynthesis pyrimidine reductase
MRVTEVHPATGTSIDLDTDDGRAWLERTYAPGDHVRMRLNMITALTGSAVGADGTSETLTSPTDRAVLRTIRAHADAVVVGAASVRAEGYVVPRHARLAVLTTTGDLRGHRLGDGASRVLLVCPNGRLDAVRERAGIADVDILGVGDGDTLNPHDVIAALSTRSLDRLVCEGGPAVASLFANADLIDEFCVTVAPALAPSSRPFLDAARPLDTEVSGMLVDEAAFSYLRLRPRRRDRARVATP